MSEFLLQFQGAGIVHAGSVSHCHGSPEYNRTIVNVNTCAFPAITSQNALLAVKKSSNTFFLHFIVQVVGLESEKSCFDTQTRNLGPPS